MKRTIKFRGYNKKNNKWIYGYYLVNRGQHFVVEDGIANPQATWKDFLVEEDTIGQYTGLIDKNGKEIYEGDVVITKQFGKIVKRGQDILNVSSEDCFVIKYINAQFMVERHSRSFYLHRNINCEVIGNIYHNGKEKE